MRNPEKGRRLIELLSNQGTAAANFNMAAARVFFAVAETEGLTQSELAKKIDMPMASLSRTVRALSDDKGLRNGLGFLKLTTSADDWRAVMVSLTGKGRALMEQVDLILNIPPSESGEKKR